MDVDTLNTLRTCGILLLLLPLLGAVLAGGLGRPLLRGKSHFGVLGAVICSVVVFFKINGLSHEEGAQTSWMVPVYDWLSAGGGTWFKVSFLIDALTCVMLVTVTFISLLVVIYSRDYMREHGVPVNRLHREGYPSVGCAPCTRATGPDEDPRAGRWWWENADTKECGLHPGEEADGSGI